jgi:hypothetical protein
MFTAIYKKVVILLTLSIMFISAEDINSPSIYGEIHHMFCQVEVRESLKQMLSEMGHRKSEPIIQDTTIVQRETFEQPATLREILEIGYAKAKESALYCIENGPAAAVYVASKSVEAAEYAKDVTVDIAFRLHSGYQWTKETYEWTQPARAVAFKVTSTLVRSSYRLLSGVISATIDAASVLYEAINE